MTAPVPMNLEAIYKRRFDPDQDSRRAVWGVLVSVFFFRFIHPDSAVLDLGCGYGEFINAVQARRRCGIDMNPAVRDKLAADVEFFLQDASEPWCGIREDSLDIVFTSNFLEHLPDRAAVSRTIREAHRCLKPGGRLIAIGPNVKYLGGHYWDFWDHQIPFTENSLCECLWTAGLSTELCVARFLPFMMSSGRRYPLFLVKLYLAIPLIWRLVGRQFLVVARKTQGASTPEGEAFHNLPDMK
jgi:SAM-dependent methyltransferase